jgi:hypothetical protein
VAVGQDDGKISSTSASPSILEFETYLEKQGQGRPNDVAEVAAMKSRPKSMCNNEFWQGVLESEQLRLANDVQTRTVAVDDILLGGSSDDDDIPIVTQLPKKLALLASLAEVPIPSPKQRKKKAPKSLWTYETVAEPTGAA